MSPKTDFKFAKNSDGFQGQLTITYSPFNKVTLNLPANVIRSLTVGGLIIPEKNVPEGLLVKSYSAVWMELVKHLAQEWSTAFELKPHQWEEIIAGAFNKEGYEVTLTPRSGDHGRDVIAVRRGVGSVRILGSVKAFRAGRLVTREHVHEMLGVVTSDQSATKGIIATTSDFAPKILTDPGLARSVPYRLELMNGPALQTWLGSLSNHD